MYSRRLKLNKKKPKPTKQKPTAPGSNWGPRLALIERERAQAGGGILEEDEEEPYDIQQELVYNVKKQIKQTQSHPHQQHTNSSNNSGGSGGSSRSNNDVDPVLRLGRSSSPNYFYYNYSRRAAPNTSGSGQTRKISCPEQSSTRNYGKTQSNLQQQAQHQRRASYVLGSSSGYCSGSVTTLSTCANNGNPEPPNFEQFTKPLTLIIPSQERYDCVNGSKMYGKKYSKNNALRTVDCEDDFGPEVQSQDSFPSSSAYQSSGDEGDGVERYRHEKREMNRAMGPKRHFHNPMANMKSSSGGILQISTKEVVQVHAPPPPSSPQITLEDTGTEPETLEMGAEENDESNANTSNSILNEGNGNRDKMGSTITALAQGITMVYVPMEGDSQGVNVTVNKDCSGDNNMDDDECDYEEDPLPEYNEPVDLPELGQHSDDCSASTSSSSRGSASGGCANSGGGGVNEAEQDSLSSNFILKRKIPDQQIGVDSLLDSFDSILFKPKPGEALRKSQERCQTQLPSLPEHKGIRKRPEQPPPLPPSNGTGRDGHKPMEKQKNLRFALENLETVLNPSLRTLSSGDEQQITPLPAPKKVLKKVTLSLPTEDNFSSRNHELLLNYEELNNCSSEILSCGHVKSDDYSTLSSLTSSAQEISDFDDLGSNHGNNSNHSGDVEVASNHGGSGSSGGESDAGSVKNNTTSVKSGHEPRSVLQQLRDLSRLIRGNSPTKHNAQQQQQQQQPAKPPNKAKENSSHVHFTEANSFFLHRPSPNGEGDAKRKSSDATDNSADSGKGSGSGTSGSGSGSSGQEGSSSSAEPSPNNVIVGGCGAPNSNCPSGVSAKIKHSRRLHIATIRGRGGGTGSHHHYTLCPDDEDDDAHCREETCSQKSGCSCQDCCDYRSDCNECQMYNKPPVPVAGFPKPSNSEELCSNEAASIGVGVRKKQVASSTPKTSRPPSRIVRRTSSRVRAVRRTASLKKSKFANNGNSSSSRKPVILDYCDCSNCDLADLEFEAEDEEMHRLERGSCCSDKNCRAPPPPHRHEPLLIPIKNSGKCKSKTGRIPNAIINVQGRKISTSSGSSGISSSSSAGKTSRISAFRSSAAAAIKQQQQQPPNQQQHHQSQLLRKSDAASTGAALNNPTSVVPLPSAGNLFTIDEANEDSVYGESGTAVVIGKGARSTSKQQQQPLPAVPRPEFQLHHHQDDEDEENFDDNVIQNMPPKRASNSRSHTQHSHPKCWLAPDATLGWSDLESLYSQNMKVDGKAAPGLRDECPTCWKELSEMKKNAPDPNRTVDRTKRMFIWLNRRHKEFHAPWWEAKKQASMRWLVTKAFAHVPKDKVPDPFKESKKVCTPQCARFTRA
ncbi:unnamed protein product [Orchesella dallaii]|uniref:Uncharacterized protein n=1 Tax=Orchesella dallaii TaxID=48710 RepID=A0ABP1PNR4_9HEXA